MQAAGLEYLQHDNCFPYIANWTKAQRLMDRQLKTRWPKLLNGIARQRGASPGLEDLRGGAARDHIDVSSHRGKLLPREAFRRANGFSDLRVIKSRYSKQFHQTFQNIGLCIGGKVSDFFRT
ncbi:MAG TPA: hypothetical protein VIX37_17960, partial [Candidatus Sulfotelmatobacter sp.]